MMKNYPMGHPPLFNYLFYYSLCIFFNSDKSALHVRHSPAKTEAHRTHLSTAGAIRPIVAATPAQPPRFITTFPHFSHTRERPRNNLFTCQPLAFYARSGKFATYGLRHGRILLKAPLLSTA
jgi:hypothetical protein